jgi:hypothetical protein
MVERTLPLRVAIDDGESLDSWLERLAYRNLVPVRQFMGAVGASAQHYVQWAALTEGLPAEALRGLERRAGLATGRLDVARVPVGPQSWTLTRGSRFCPRCLAEDGCWPLRWRLPWTFACPRHLVLMPDRCLSCAQPCRLHLSGGAGLVPVSVCTTRLAGGYCHADLTATPRWLLDADDPRLHAQQWINRRLDQFTRVRPGTAADDLSDLAVVAAEIRRRATEADFTGYGRATMAAFTDFTRARNDSHRPARQAFTNPLLIAAVAVITVELLAASSNADIARLLRPWLGRRGTDRNRRGRTSALPSNPQLLERLSPPRQSHWLAAIETSLAPMDRLRFRACGTGAARIPPRGATPSRVAHLPQLLWPEWAIRFTDPAGPRQADTLREAIPCCLLMVGARDGTRRHTLAGLRQQWQLHAHLILVSLPEPARTAMIAAICRIADYLDTHGSPINYQRRRDTIGTDLITVEQWQQLCYTTMAHPGIGRGHLDARRYLYQLLTGADLDEPHADLTWRNPADRSSYLLFADRLTTPQRAALHDHARGLLDQARLAEPLTWTPPGSCAAGLKLPGREPDDIDTAAVERLILVGRLPVGAVADQLDRSVDHVRYALHHAVVRPARAWGPQAAPRAWHTAQRAHATLTPEFFHREYVQAGKRLHQLHTETGFHRKILADHAKAHGIPLARARQPHHIDEAWLRDQYLDQRRSFVAIAAQLGLSQMTIARAARDYGIPPRPSGIASHPHLVAETSDLPPDIRRAIDGHLHGWLRLRRFQQATAYPSLTQAARHEGVHAATLVTQIRRLERDIGAALLHRATPTSPATLTGRGADLLRDLQQPHIQALIDTHGTAVRSWAPDDPRRTRPRKPRPSRPTRPLLADNASDDLRHAVNGQPGAWARLQRFATAMTYPTLTDAAAAIGVDQATLIEQMRRLERDIGTRLFHRATPASEPQRPTQRGNALLRVLAEHGIHGP